MQGLEALRTGFTDDAHTIDDRIDMLQVRQPVRRGGHVGEIDAVLARHRRDSMSRGGKRGRDVAADEAAGSGQQDVHDAPPVFCGAVTKRPRRSPTMYRPINIPPKAIISAKRQASMGSLK